MFQSNVIMLQIILTVIYWKRHYNFHFFFCLPINNLCKENWFKLFTFVSEGTPTSSSAGWHSELGLGASGGNSQILADFKGPKTESEDVGFMSSDSSSSSLSSDEW